MAASVPLGEWVSLPDAAKLLGKHRQQVLTLIVRGELAAETRGRFTFVSRASIDRYIADHAEPATASASR